MVALVRRKLPIGFSPLQQVVVGRDLRISEFSGTAFSADSPPNPLTDTLTVVSTAVDGATVNPRMFAWTQIANYFGVVVAGYPVSAYIVNISNGVAKDISGFVAGELKKAVITPESLTYGGRTVSSAAKALPGAPSYPIVNRNAVLAKVTLERDGVAIMDLCPCVRDADDTEGLIDLVTRKFIKTSA